MQLLHGHRTTLRPATPDDRRPIFEWLALSDVTHLMLGAPTFPETPAPSWEEFLADYRDHYFDGSQPRLGRCFVILADGEPVGQITYNEIDPAGPSTEVDIWLSAAEHMSKGYGGDALRTLCDYLHRTFGCREVYIAPSQRNAPAVRAYRKAGFEEATAPPAWFVPDYPDAVVLVRRMAP